MSLIDDLIQQGWLKTPRIIEAFKHINRADFLPGDLKKLAQVNEAFPIGEGQTISQPLVVAFMLEQLQPKPGEKILDIGSGSGWTTALLAHIVGGEELKSKIKNQKSKIYGKVIAMEIIPELKDFGKSNVSKYNFIKKGIVEFVLADGRKGYKKEAPYDKILCSAEAKALPLAWKQQLKIGGRIVTPMDYSIYVFDKIAKNEFKQQKHPGFVFVPLTTP